ncbi:helix-turn-helix domain-containing protein [Actinoalloteichus sp. AHMU CJ021]|uniref:Transcriptional regulator, XRE family with cupin sensor n=1 Tax=Actinoalloteichus caeruleus DSM 43889 TaxID=1120930 RepID=A0ABT1JG72_ACTCY|nr:helix-turn-helix domain-containing protein [Actinoalloteichus caeruleus]AUS77610.1 helix-turn-helix domain-containing protein [Actinoalloteichus sp. AHMU CJ021]MCP2331502.1 transcriptional regulator, XRE family with cupin sensor [Actinoalloteichus caeruleus DSM 43889]
MAEALRGTGDAPPLATIARALRRERQRAGMSLSELARRAGVAKSTLSQLEGGGGNPSVETLWALGVALGVPFSRLVEPAAPRVRVVRAGEGPVVRSETAPYQAVLLASCPPAARRDVYTITLEPGNSREADPHIPGTVEHLVVSNGRLRCGPHDDVIDLGPGDYASFPGDVPHHYQALEPGTSAVLIMEHV